MIELLANHNKQMIWVDETATNIDMCRTCGRAAPGVRVKVTRRRKCPLHTIWPTGAKVRNLCSTADLGALEVLKADWLSA